MMISDRNKHRKIFPADGLNDLISSIDRKTLVEFYTDKWLDQIHLYCLVYMSGFWLPTLYTVLYSV